MFPLASETEIEDRVGNLLRYGVMASCILTIAGMLLYAFTPKGDIIHFIGDQVVLAGVIVLLLTPAAMVAMLFGHYVVRKDYDFVAITLFVLAMMVLGYIFGAA